MDCMIDQGRLFEFVLEFMDFENEKTLWELYLHKVFDKSFNEFKNSIPKSNVQPKENLETTVKNSFEILGGFNPNP